MGAFEWAKMVHISCAVVSIAGFTLRGYWMLTGNALLKRRLARTLPHMVDTLLLGSAIYMLVLWGVSPLQFSWLLAKIVALLAYIGLGMVALRFGNTRRTRLLAYALAVLCAGYIFTVAYSKSPLGLLQVFVS